MTDEERAEEYVIKRYGIDKCYKEKNEETKKYMKIDVHIDYEEEYLCYLDGLTEGKPKWHDLRKDPNDLPKLADKRFPWSITVANQNGEACIYNYRRSRWQTCIFTEIDEPIKWCELPKFKE